MIVTTSPFERQQNLSLCIASTALSGLLRTVATMVLAFPEYLAKRWGARATNRARTVVYVLCHVLLLAVAALLSIAGAMFGPIGIAVPIQTGSQLLCNAVAMGVVLRMRAFDKTQRTGTYVVVFSVLSLIDVGPDVQNGQDVITLLSKPYALTWVFFITICMLTAAIATLPLLFSNTTKGAFGFFRKVSFVTLAVGCTCSNVSMATAGKALGSLQGNAFLAAAVYYTVASVLGLLFSITSSTACDQGIFTPLCSVALIIVNMVTGILIWEDWKVIDTWTGYLCACTIMCLGVYLLAEIDLFEYFWREKSVPLVLQQSDDIEVATPGGPNGGGNISLPTDPSTIALTQVSSNSKNDGNIATMQCPIIEMKALPARNALGGSRVVDEWRALL